MSETNNTDTTALPVFPARAPAVFDEPTAAAGLLAPVLADLAVVVAVDEAKLDGPTPCRDYTVGGLRNHVLAWLQFFAAALNDPDGRTERLDPDGWTLEAGADPSAIVRRASDGLITAVEGGVGDRLVVLSQARMRGSAAVAMTLGEYIVHGWDLAVATGRPWQVADEAAIEARRFLEGVVAPDHRGEDSGFFAAEVEVAAGAPALDRLLGFAGRNPDWRPEGSTTVEGRVEQPIDSGEGIGR